MGGPGLYPPPSIAHSVQSLQARKVGEWHKVVPVGHGALQQYSCVPGGLRGAEEPLLVSHLGTEEDTELVQYFLLRAI